MVVRMLSLFLVFTLWSGGAVYAQAPQCEEYLSLTELDLKTSRSFNQNLAQVNDLSSFNNFVKQLSRVIYNYPAKDKRSFVRTGLYDLEKMSSLYIREMDVVSLEVLIRLFTKIRHLQMSENFLVNVENAILINLEDLEARNISASIYLLGQLRLRPSVKFSQKIEAEFIKRKDEFSPQNLSNIIFGFSVLGVKPSQNFFKAWRERYVFIQDEFLDQNIANSLFSFYLMGSDEMVKWFVRATAEEKWDEIKGRPERRQISQVYEYYEKVKDYRLKPIIKFKGQFNDLVEKPKGAQSEFEEKVEMGLAMSGIDYETEFKTKPGFYVDFFIPEKNRIIQVDGPSHFIKEIVDGVFVENQRPQDLLIDEVLKVFGYQIKRQSYRTILLD